ncbi:MAG: hypothetical protein WAN06_09030 [Candidatus Sulfotelmatobacter sp.]
MSKNVLVLDRSVRITELEISRTDVADFLRTVDADEVASTLIQAIEVGVFCLERARMTQDTEFIRRQIDQILNRVEVAVGKIPEETQKALIAKIGSGNGQVLAPIKEMIETASKVSTDRVKEVRTLLTQEIDPDKETTTLGKALRALRNLLDPKRSDSVQNTLEQAVKTVTGKDGALARAVKEVVGEAIKPVATELDKLAKEVRGRDAAEEALEQTTKKGPDYENEVLEDLQQWAGLLGAEVHHVGVDNRPGDILIKMPANGVVGMPLLIVVEARDRQSAVGRKVISDTLSRAMAERKATGAVYLSKTTAGLAAEVGEWADGTADSGPFVACTHENLSIAIRWLIIQNRLTQTNQSAVAVDSTAILQQVQRIRTSVDRVKTMNRKVTDVRSSANDIQTEAEALRDEVRASLAIVEDALRSAVPLKKAAVSVAGD